MDGNARVIDGRIDIGADEFDPEKLLIRISPYRLHFDATVGGPNPEGRILSIQNMSPGILNWQINYDCNWLTAEPDSGSAGLEPNEVVLSVDVTDLPPGVYDCNLIISAPYTENSPKIIHIQLAVQGPILKVSRQSISVHALWGRPNPPDESFTINNVGAGTLNWRIDYECDWLTVEPNSGLTTDQPSEVTLSFDSSSLDQGVYKCDLVVSDTNAENSPQIINVELILHTPIIELSDSVFSFQSLVDGPNPEPKILSIGNAGGGTLNWRIDYDSNWLTVEPNSGSCTIEPSQVVLGVNAPEVVPGYYSCDLVISDPNAENSPQIVKVSLHIGADCFPSSFTPYHDWVTYGKPNCWCGIYGDPPCPYQCDGDADCKTEGALKYRVFSKDLACMISQWKKRIRDVTDPCCDFDHKAEGASGGYRVFSKDLGVLVAGWKKKDADLPGNCPRPE
jgi:hypothetical protein